MRIVIFASGAGTNARAILEAVKDGSIKNAKVVALISDVQNAPALDVAREFGADAIYLDPQNKGARMSEGATFNYINEVEKCCPNVVVLAGFMRIVPPQFVQAFAGKIINLHPSILPAYKGKNAIERAFEAGETECGCTVHYVNNELDGGKIIAQSFVKRLNTDTIETLEAKVHAAEHKLLVDVLKNMANTI